MEEPITLSSLEVVKQKAHEFSVIKKAASLHNIYNYIINLWLNTNFTCCFCFCYALTTGCCEVEQTTEQKPSRDEQRTGHYRVVDGCWSVARKTRRSQQR